MCGVAESASVLLCVRNIVVLHLVHHENISNYVTLASEYLIAPIRFNFIAIVALIAALAIYAFWQFQWLTGFIFVFGIILPAVISFLHSTAAGIKALYEVQPWSDSEITLTKAKVLKVKKTVVMPRPDEITADEK